MTRANPHPPSHRALRAAALLGVALADDGRLPSCRRATLEAHLPALAAAIDARLPRGHVALITGPSGCGKSSLLRALHAHARRRRRVITLGLTHPPRPRQSARRVIDLGPRSLDRWLAALAHAGLAEVALLFQHPRTLSAGEQSRLALAQAAARHHKSHPDPPLVLIDEFASVLDRPSALALARAVARHAAATGLRLVLATAHDDLLPALHPALHINLAHLEPHP